MLALSTTLPVRIQDAGFSRHWLLRPMSFCRERCRTLCRKSREKRTQALRGRNLGRDTSVDSAPRVRAVSASLCPSRLSFSAHWTQELMPPKIHFQTGVHFQTRIDASKTSGLPSQSLQILENGPTDSADEAIFLGSKVRDMPSFTRVIYIHTRR